MLVPMIATRVPGPVTDDAGTDTWASTLATATGIPGGSPVHTGRARGQAAGRLAEPDDRPRHLVVDDAAEAGIERGEERPIRKAVVGRPHRLVAGRAVVARLDAGQLPDRPSQPPR